MPAQLAERYRYVEEEYVLEGEATAYRPVGELGEDGRWAVTQAGTAPYRSRILVRRPADPDAFDGTVTSGASRWVGSAPRRSTPPSPS
jgi:hypothetical protein